MFKDVFISSDISFQQRQQDANFRTIVNDLRRDKLMVNGNHVIPTSRDHGQTADTTHERRSDQFQSRSAQRNDRNSERDRRDRNPEPSRDYSYGLNNRHNVRRVNRDELNCGFWNVNGWRTDTSCCNNRVRTTCITNSMSRT